MTLVSVISSPRIDVMIMMPISQNEMCCDQNRTYRQKKTITVRNHVWSVISTKAKFDLPTNTEQRSVNNAR